MKIKVRIGVGIEQFSFIVRMLYAPKNPDRFIENYWKLFRITYPDHPINSTIVGAFKTYLLNVTGVFYPDEEPLKVVDLKI